MPIKLQIYQGAIVENCTICPVLNNKETFPVDTSLEVTHESSLTPEYAAWLEESDVQLTMYEIESKSCMQGRL